MRTKIILLALVAALSGCMDEGGYDEAGFEQLVDRQANIEDVTDRLGQPDQVINSDGAVVYIYEYERDLLAFTFYNGELLFKERAANDGLYDFKMIKPRAQ
ncbi:conserved hypothetical protein [Vibrio chagasii]|nr:conserved hypothetical protein [Vibrio chagasii]